MPVRPERVFDKAQQRLACKRAFIPGAASGEGEDRYRGERGTES